MRKVTIELKWALLFTVVALLWMVLEKAVGLHDELIRFHATYTNFFAIPAIIIFVLGMKDKKRNYYGGLINFRQAFTSGALMTAFIMVFSPLSQVVTHYLITPDYFANLKEYAIASGEATRAEAENYFNLPSYIMQSIIGSAVMGLITSALVALFIKQDYKHHKKTAARAGR